MSELIVGVRHAICGLFWTVTLPLRIFFFVGITVAEVLSAIKEWSHTGTYDWQGEYAYWREHALIDLLVKGRLLP